MSDITITDQPKYYFPDLKFLMPHQKEVLFDQHRYKVLVWPRRHFKTFTALTKLILEAINPRAKPHTFWFIQPTYAEAKSSVWLEQSMLFGEQLLGGPLKQTIDRVNESELLVKFKNGSILSLKGGDNAERLLGANPYGVILDEFAMFKTDEIYHRILLPILKANKGFMWVTSTPKSHNHFYQLYQKGLSGDKDWKSFFLSADSNVRFSDEELESIKSNMPLRIFNQEYLCHFLEGSGALLRGVKEAAVLEPIKPKKNRQYVMGVDLAKSHDFTAITIMDTGTNDMVYCSRWNQLEWPHTKSKIIEYSKYYNNAVIILDSTGLGSPILDDIYRMKLEHQSDPYQEDLVNAGQSVYGITLTAGKKQELIEKLSIYLEQKRIRIINDPALVSELEAYTFEVTPTGHIRYTAPQGLNDDYVIATALAVSYLNQVRPDEEVKQPTQLQTDYQRRVKKLLEKENDNDPFADWLQGQSYGF